MYQKNIHCKEKKCNNNTACPPIFDLLGVLTVEISFAVFDCLIAKPIVQTILSSKYIIYMVKLGIYISVDKLTIIMYKTIHYWKL